MTTDQAAADPRFTYSESIHIDASPQQVWNVVTDIERTGEWSPICRACWWKAPASGPVEGAWFHGRNEAGDQVWETESLVMAAEKPVEFTWMVGGNAVRWSYALVPSGAGTSLTESWEVQPQGFEMFGEIFGDDADAQLEVRREAARQEYPPPCKQSKRLWKKRIRRSRSPWGSIVLESDVGMRIIGRTVTFDAKDLGVESAFWAGVFGGEVVGDNQYREIRCPNGTTPVGVQWAPDLVSMNWPQNPVRAHLDLVVADIETAHAEVLSLGATLLQRTPGGEFFNVYVDPAGHPFCLCWEPQTLQ